MARFVGDQGKTLFQYESGTYAATSGTGHWIGLVTESNIATTENVNNLRYLGAADRDIDIFVDGARDHEGTATFHPQDWKFLGLTLGSTVDSGSPSPYIHTFTATNNDNSYAYTSGTQNPFASFTIEDSQSSAGGDGFEFVRTAVGCNVDNWTFSCAEGEIATVELTYVAQSVNYSSGTSTAVTAATLRPFLWSDILVHIPSGTVYDEIKSVSLSAGNNLVRPHYLNGSRDIGTPIPTNRDYQLDLTLDASSERTKTLYDEYFRGGSTFNVLFEVTAADAGAGSRDCLMSFSGCRITEMDAPTTRDGVEEQTITIMPKTATVVVNDLIQLYNPW
jgi:hypothetical protein